MDRRHMLAIVLLAALCLSAPALCLAADDDAILQALAEKAASIRDMHYQAVWETPDGYPVLTVDYWYAAPDRMRVAARHGGDEDISVEVFVRGHESCTKQPDNYYIGRAWAPERANGIWRSPVDALPLLYLAPGQLRWWSKVRIVGQETVGDRPCDIVELTAPGPKLTGRLEEGESEFVEFTPFHWPRAAMRLHVDHETGMVWRWDTEHAGEQPSRSGGEVVETQLVDGLLFPSAARTTGGCQAQIVRITEATVNRRIPDAVFELEVPRGWLVLDFSLTPEQIVQQLEKTPDDAGLHYLLGIGCRDAYRFDEAARELGRAAELAPESPCPLLGLASFLGWANKPRLEAATEAARGALALSGESSQLAVVYLASLLVSAGKDEDATHVCRDALPRLRGTAARDVADRLADLLAGQDDFEGAYRALAQRLPDMLARRSEQEEPILDWAEQSGRLADLRTKIEAALAEHPRSFRGRLLLAQVQQALEQRAEALRTLRSLPLEAARDEWTACGAASLARDLGDDDLAARFRRVAINAAIEAGSRWPVGDMLVGDDGPPPAVVASLAAEAAAAYAEAGDARSRSAVLGSIGRAASAISDVEAICEALSGRPPQEMTAAECAVAGAMEAGQIEHWGLPWAATDVRAHAAACLARALPADPDSASLWALLGSVRWVQACWEDADWEPVAEAYSKAAELDPDGIKHAARLAFAYARLGKCDQALDIASEAVEAWPQEWAAATFRAALQMDCGQLGAARDGLAAAYASPHLRSDYYRRGDVAHLLVDCQERLGDLEQAEWVLKREVAHAPDNPAVSMQRLLGFYRRHDRHSDLYPLARSLHQMDVSPWPYGFAIGVVVEVAHDHPAALAAAIEADLADHPGDLDAIRFASRVYRNAGRPAELQDALRAAAARVPEGVAGEARDSPDTWRKVADIYLLAEAWEDALTTAKRAAALTAEDDEAGRMRAEVLVARAYAGSRDDQEARRRLIPILARAEDPTVLREAADALVNLYLARGERDQAIATLKDLRLRTDHWQLHGWIDRRLKDIAEAEGPGRE